jgi:hypothetical protein
MKNFLPLQGLQSMKYNIFLFKKVLLRLQRKKVAQKGYCEKYKICAYGLK